MSSTPGRTRVVWVAARRLRRGLAALPDPEGWWFSAGAGALTLGAMAIVGVSSGLYRLKAPDLSGLPIRMLVAFFAPALGEEAVFRGLFVPDRSETSRPWATIAMVTVAFTCWHVAETIWLPRAAPVFLRADFLACAAILGAGCAIVRWRTGSLWPAIGLHWLAVVVWQTWLGGPGLAALG